MVTKFLSAVALFAGCVQAVPALAETLTFDTMMSGKNESPPNDSPATGEAVMTFDTETKLLGWTVEYKDLTGPAIGAHIHGPAGDGNNAGIMIPFKTVDSPIKGEATLNDTQVKALMDGALYVNIHTKQNPGGEIRGQVGK